MKEILLQNPRRPLSLWVVIALISAFMIASISHAQTKEQAPIETKEQAPIAIEFYKMSGRLQVLDLDHNWAQIDGLRWELADNFDKDSLSRVWKKKGIVEFTEGQEVWIHFYVSLVPGALSADVRSVKEEEIRLITKKDTIEKIHDRGGKVYKIERIPA